MSGFIHNLGCLHDNNNYYYDELSAYLSSNWFAGFEMSKKGAETGPIGLEIHPYSTSMIGAARLVPVQEIVPAFRIKDIIINFVLVL